LILLFWRDNEILKKLCQSKFCDKHNTYPGYIWLLQKEPLFSVITQHRIYWQCGANCGYVVIIFLAKNLNCYILSCWFLSYILSQMSLYSISFFLLIYTIGLWYSQPYPLHETNITTTKRFITKFIQLICIFFKFSC
jgi:hypothetical protein